VGQQVENEQPYIAFYAKSLSKAIQRASLILNLKGTSSI